MHMRERMARGKRLAGGKATASLQLATAASRDAGANAWAETGDAGKASFATMER